MPDAHVIPALAVAQESSMSCESCKFFTDGNSNAWGSQNPGTCSTFGGRPVDLTIMTREEAAKSHQEHASKCGRYNSPTEKAHPEADFHQVGVPTWDPDDEELSAISKAQCKSCETCVNFVGQNNRYMNGFVQEMGLPVQMGICTAKGYLIKFGNSSIRMASKCEYRQNVAGTDWRIKSAEDLDEHMKFLLRYNMPKFREKYMGEQPAPGGLPAGYDPDKFVAGQKPVDGIAAWVKIVDPTGTGNSIDLPVFGDVFDERESAKIPRSIDEERPDLYIDWEGLTYTLAVAWTELNETPALVGPAGVGKTELYRHLAWIMRLPFERITITDSSELDELQGYTEFIDNQTRFKYGRVPLAWGKPCVLLIDEPNVGPRAVWQFLRPLTDNSKQLVIDAADGVPIKRHDNCYMGFAMNPAWDIKNDGTNELADADIRRLFHVEVGYPDDPTEAKIIANHCALSGFEIPSDLLGWVQRVGHTLRNMGQALPISWGLSQQIKVAKLLNWFGPVKAYNLAAGNYLDPEIRQNFLNDVIATYPKA